ncbi:MAG: carbohydrate-binding module family 14 protein [Methyloceanibacter sp.]
MSRIVLAVMAITAMLAVGFDALAASKKCPEGFYYDEETGKCVSRRGSD